MPYGICVFFFKQKTAYELRISDWSSDVCSSDLADMHAARQREMAVVLARGIEPVRAFELVRVEIARGVEGADPIAGLDLDPVPFEVALHLASRIDERLSAQEFLDRRIDEHGRAQ